MQAFVNNMLAAPHNFWYFFIILIEYFLLSSVIFIFNSFKNILIFTYLVILKTILLNHSSVITREWIRRDVTPLKCVEFYFVAHHTLLLSMCACKHPLYLLARECCVWLPFFPLALVCFRVVFKTGTPVALGGLKQCRPAL